MRRSRQTANYNIGGSKGDAGDVRPPLGLISFIFMQFAGKFWPNNKLAPHLGGWKILDPPERKNKNFHKW